MGKEPEKEPEEDTGKEAEEAWLVFRMSLIGCMKVKWLTRLKRYKRLKELGKTGALGKPLFPSLAKPCRGRELTLLDRWRRLRLRSYRYRQVILRKKSSREPWLYWRDKERFLIKRWSIDQHPGRIVQSSAVPGGRSQALQHADQMFLAADNDGGIEAGAAWSVQKGCGEKAHVVLLDLGCGKHGHLPDVDGAEDCKPDGVRRCAHGVAVMGVLGTSNDESGESGAAGICHEASLSFKRVEALKGGRGDDLGHSNVCDLLAQIGDCSVEGTVVVVPLEAVTMKGFALPLEAWPFVRKAIRYAIGRGVHVVLSAGNGAQDIGRYLPCFADSGSIVVGCSSSLAPARVWKSNYGERVDVHSWGHDVATLSLRLNGSQNARPVVDATTLDFGLTSAATAIVAGTVASLVSILSYHRTVAEAHRRYHCHQGEGRLEALARSQIRLLTYWSRPAQLRRLLVSTSYGQTPGIGGRPSISAALAFLARRGIRFYSAVGGASLPGHFQERPWRKGTLKSMKWR